LPRSLRAVGAGLRTGWLIVGITLLLIVVGEAGLRLALTTRDWLMDRPLTEHQATEEKIARWAGADAYHDAEWVRDYYRELQSVRPFLWQPYVYWRRPPYQGRTIAVDRNGLRATWNPPPGDLALDSTPVRVFAFGASVLWGPGARDDYTVPSYLSKLLHARGYRAEVTNYGESAYVSTQSAITLLRCIHRGEIPDIALFYDGDNDVIASYVYGEAGIPHKEETRRAEFDLLDRPQELLQTLGHQLRARNLWGFDRFVTGLRRSFRSPPAPRLQVGPLDDAVARQTLHVYAANLAFIEALGRSYGFESLFYWQPNVFSKQNRSPGEQTAAAGAFLSAEVYDDIYRRLGQSEALNAHPRFRDISALFGDSEAPYYVDGTHLSEPGNRLVAKAMVEDVIALIEQRRSAAAENRATE